MGFKKEKNRDLTPVWDKAPARKSKRRTKEIEKEKLVIPIKKEKPIKDLTPIWDAPPKPKRKEKNVKIKKDPTLFEKYHEKVYELTAQNKHLIEGIEKRGWRNFHIDHKLSIQWGFSKNIPPENIAHIDNLRMLWWEDNMDKGIGCFVDDKNAWIRENLDIYPIKAK